MKFDPPVLDSRSVGRNDKKSDRATKGEREIDAVQLSDDDSNCLRTYGGDARPQEISVISSMTL
jgi:hypothetical protein